MCNQNRILVIGCCGSGKSTLSKQLGQILDLPVVHLDKLFWRPGWVSVSAEEFDGLLMQELAKDRWIIDGNYTRTLPMRLELAGVVIFLDFARPRCMWGVIRRILQSYGKIRDDMGEGCPERLDWDFLRYTWNFNKKHRDKLYQILQQHADVTVYILKNRRQVKGLLRQWKSNDTSMHKGLKKIAPG